MSWLLLVFALLLSPGASLAANSGTKSLPAWVKNKMKNCISSQEDSSNISQSSECEKGDFDKNGTQDFWIYRCDDDSVHCQSFVVLRKKTKVLRVIKLSALLNTPTLIPAGGSDYPYLKDYGCKMPQVDGLVEQGDGVGRENRIYILNKDKKDFHLFSKCTTEERDAEE